MTGDTFSERGDLSGVLEDLERLDGLLEKHIQENPRGWNGKKISETFLKHTELRHWVNVIPGGRPGECRNTLIVFVGKADDDKVLLYRISAAINHVGVPELCMGKTKTRNVVFYGTWWNTRTWATERWKTTLLPEVLWILKMPFAKPQVLG